jgi:hypothetical protein
MVAAAQGTFYVASGLSPFVSRRLFTAVTGPKPEWWLVQTVGALVTAIGGALTTAAARDRVTSELALLGAASAASLAAIDVVYAARRRISPVYLVDALAELALVGGWAAARGRP